MSERQPATTYRQPKGIPLSVPEPGSPAAMALEKHERNTNRLGLLKKASLRVGAPAVAFAVMVGGGAALLERGQNAPAPQDKTVQINPGSEVVPNAEAPDKNKELRERATSGAVDAAIGILDILDDKRSTTTEGYRGNMVGTKDAKRPANVPEIAVSFDQEKGEMYFLAAQGYATKTGKMTAGFAKGPENEAFTSLTMTLGVDRTNSIYDIHRQLTTADFRAALAAKSTLELESAEGSWFEVGIPGTRGYSIETFSGGFKTSVVEDSDSGSGYISVDELPKTDPGTLARAVQIMGSSVESFKKDLNR